MKKIFGILFVTMIILLGVFYYYNKQPKNNTNDNTNNKIIKGNKIEDNIYGINLNTNEINSYIIDGDYIYYSINDNNTNVFYKYNIYDGSNTKLFDSSNYYDCKLYNSYLYCPIDNKTDIYDNNGNLVDSKDGISISYKNQLYYIKDNKLFDNDLKEIFSLDSKYDNYLLSDYIFVNENLFLIYNNYDIEVKTILCDVNKKTCENNNLKTYIKYENGLYNVENSKVSILDLSNNIFKEYDIKLNRGKYYSNYLDKNNNLYIYNSNLGRLEIFDLNNDQVKIYDLKNITVINVVNDMIFLKLLDSDYDFYIIKDDDKFKNYNIDDYVNLINDSLSLKINDIKDNFNVNISYENIDSFKKLGYIGKECNDVEELYLAIDKINEVLNKFSKEFFNSYENSSDNGLYIYLSNEITSKNGNTHLAGFTTYYNNKHQILLDITQFNLKSNTCHELMHFIENILYNMGEYMSDWTKLNPKRYDYLYSYTQRKTDYTIGTTTDDNVYFVDYYSHSYPSEDRARIFEMICSKEKDSEIKKYNHLMLKGEYLKEKIYNYFPSMKESTLFESME